jgi:hypothetical protein
VLRWQTLDLELSWGSSRESTGLGLELRWGSTLEGLDSLSLDLAERQVAQLWAWLLGFQGCKAVSWLDGDATL